MLQVTFIILHVKEQSKDGFKRCLCCLKGKLSLSPILEQNRK